MRTVTGGDGVTWTCTEQTRFGFRHGAPEGGYLPQPSVAFVTCTSDQATVGPLELPLDWESREAFPDEEMVQQIEAKRAAPALDDEED